MREIIIIGGGLAGLVSSILLKRQGRDVVLIEKKTYPFHRVCGEYVSNEVKNFLTVNRLMPAIACANIDTFGLSSTDGNIAYEKLDLGGFGISRYFFDHFLYQSAISEGVECITGESVDKIVFDKASFQIKLHGGIELTSQIVIGAFGKRSNLDQQLNRAFFFRRSPYIGIKYHIKSDHPSNVVALHNFEGGYCGINGIEDGKTNLCYLSKRENLKKYGSIQKMEEEILFKNPQIEQLFEKSEFFFDSPEVINEISFETKKPVEQHILMCGDAAGMITPLCGNGMAMAIHSAKILCEHIQHYFTNGKTDRSQLEKGYAKDWASQFQFRLWYGRQVQRLFGNKNLSKFSIKLINNVRPLSRLMIKASHGKSF